MSKSEVWFYTGPRNCGKSEQAEQKLSSINNRIYFGTMIDGYYLKQAHSYYLI